MAHASKADDVSHSLFSNFGLCSGRYIVIGSVAAAIVHSVSLASVMPVIEISSANATANKKIGDLKF